MGRNVGIIGSGIGALATGIRLLALGYQVTIFESRKVAGGKAAGVNIEGYVLDSGPTILRMPHLYMDIFKTAGVTFGEDFPVRMVSPHYRVYQDKKHYLDISANSSQTIDNISRFSSTDANRYPAFLEHTETIYQENLTPPPTIHKKRNPILNLRPKEVLPLQPSVFQETSRFFQNSFVQQAFSFHPLLFGRNPFSTHHRSLMLHAIEQQWGILHIEGGFIQVINVLLERFQRMGGEIALNTAVDQIIMEEREAHILRLKSGKLLHFDAIVSNLSPYLTRQLVNYQTENHQDIAPQQSTSYFLLHIIFEQERTDFYPHSILATQNYGRYIQQVFNEKQLPDDPWLYLNAQKAFQSGLQPLMVMAPVPNLGSPIEWGKNTFLFRNRIVDKIVQIIPNFRERIHFERISTPVTLQEEYTLPGGSPLYPPIRRAIPNLYYVGDNTWTGLGLIASLSSAEQVAKSILMENT